jgi:hypothetical protein
MARAKKQVGRGIYQRGNIYWLAIQRNGVRKFITLETSDPAEAVKRAADIREAPDLNASSPLRAEITRFIAYKKRMNAYTASTALTKLNKLLLFAADLPDTASAAAITVRQVQQFYDSVRERVTDTTALGYMMALQAFFRWAVEIERIARRNPVKEVRFAKPLGRCAWKHICRCSVRSFPPCFLQAESPCAPSHTSELSFARMPIPRAAAPHSARTRQRGKPRIRA